MSKLAADKREMGPKEITQTNLFSLCGGSANINVNFPVPVTVDIQVAGNCPNNRVIKPSLSIYFKNNGCG